MSGFGRGMNGAVEQASAERIDGVHSGKQPTPIEHLASCAGYMPPDAQAFKQYRRDHGVAILLAFATFNAQRHALAVITNFQGDDLAGP